MFGLVLFSICWLFFCTGFLHVFYANADLQEFMQLTASQLHKFLLLPAQGQCAENNVLKTMC